MTRVVALLAAKNSAGEVGDAVVALSKAHAVDEVVVVDDGSTDSTASEASEAGATVVSHVRNRGKAAAIATGVTATPNATVYLLVDADTAKTAGSAFALLGPVLSDEADMVIGVLPSAARKGGFGSIVRIARWGIRFACDFDAKSPLSGQRAVRADLLRSMTFAPRYGLEVAMTIDAVRGGARVVEREVPMDHRHRGRGLAGFMHRGRQGLQIGAALWTRLILPKARVALLILLSFLTLMGLFSLSSFHQRAIGRPLSIDEVRVVAVPGATWDDIAGNHQRGTWASVASGSGNAIETLERGSRSPSAVSQIDVATSLSFPRALQDARPGTLVVGIDDGGRRELRPAVLVGGPQGSLYSDSTRSAGLIDLTDVTATVLARSPALYDSEGRNLSYVPGSSNEAMLEAGSLAREVATDNGVRIYTIVFICLVGLIAIGFGIRRRAPAAEVGLVLASVPLASYLIRALNLPVGALIQSSIIALVACVLTFVLVRVTNSRWSALRWVLGFTIALITIDLLTGATLQVSGVFGSDPSYGRFFGIGNPASVLLLVASVLAVAMHIEASTQKGWALARGAVFLLLVTTVDALPGLGTDVGGAIAFAFISIIALVAFTGRQASFKAAVLAVAGAVSAFAAIALVDASRPIESRTQLGNLVVQVKQDGLAPFFDIAQRKIENNLFSYGFPGSLLILLAAIVIFAVLVKSSRWSKQLSGLPRVATALAILAGLALYAVNDSGIVVVALVAVYVIPFVLVQDDVVARRKLEETTWRS